MGKIVSRIPNTKEGEGGPLYDRETELYPHYALGGSPINRTESQQIADMKAGIEFVNYNWVMAKTMGLLNAKRLDRSQAIDILFKSRELFRLSYLQVYGREPSLPQVRANGKDSQ